MALQKQAVNLTFAQGLDLKTDPWQVDGSKFLALSNSVFGDNGALSKRNGFGTLTYLANALQTTLTTFNDNLIATGTNLYAYLDDINVWQSQGIVQPVALDVKPLVRASSSQTGADAVQAPNGLICTTYTDTAVAYYQITDNITGQQVVGRTSLGSTSTCSRVFVLGAYFIITFMRTVAAAPHFQYVAVPYGNPTSPMAAADISTNVSAITGGHDGAVYNNSLYLVWESSGTAVRICRLTSTLALSTNVIFAAQTAALASVTVDEVNSHIYFSWWSSGTTDGYTTIRDINLNAILAPTKTISAITINELTSLATAGVGTLYYQVTNTYAWGSIRSDYIGSVTITSAGVVGTPGILKRGVGLASKAFYSDSIAYMLTVYGGALQPTLFLIDASANILAKVAYSNTSGYLGTQVLPCAVVNAGAINIAYLIKDLLVSVNKDVLPNTSGVYTQTGVNVVNLTINEAQQYSSEIAGSLNLTGGFVWQYDGVKPVELGFHLWPESIDIATATSGGLLTDQVYYYCAVYEWTDNVGNLHRSAPSLATTVTTTGGNTSANTIRVPTLRETAKTGTNVVRIVLYRWSVGQPVFYQATSISSPTLNSTTVDYVTIVDTLADSSILGNTILYTTGGVLENIGAPAASHISLFKSRAMLLDAEDRNLFWYSKQVLSGTPLEFTDLQTIYVAPTSGAQGSTGPCFASAAMDDKWIIFKENALYYVTGNGPAITGANNDFSDPIFITGAVGCSNPSSIVLMPLGLMFQSNKGIWLLARDLSTKYIGADVEVFNDSVISSATTIPGTNQVRFTLETGAMLMYDYYYNQWGTFNTNNCISSTLYQGAHTLLNNLGQVRKETPGLYLDGSAPVTMSFTTAWLKLTGLQGFQRAYWVTLLAEYFSPHRLNVGVSYDYLDSIVQSAVVSPSNFTGVYGSDTLYGGSSPYGGPGSVEQWQVYFDRQKCQAIQLTVSETFDSTMGTAAGAGLKLSGLNLVFGAKSDRPKLPAAQRTS